MVPIARLEDVPEQGLLGATVAGVELVIARLGERASVLYGRCPHRGALLADGTLRGEDIVCGLHRWDFNAITGISAYDNHDRLEPFDTYVRDGDVLVDEAQVVRWVAEHPQPESTGEYQGRYQDPNGTSVEPHVAFTRQLAQDGLDSVGHHGPMVSMGVPRDQLPRWDDIQFVTAQLARRPLLDDHPVETAVTVGPNATSPLVLDMPLLISDMSFGALSPEAKVALAMGADAAGTGICSEEGGMLPEEQAANSRYFHQLASAKFGWSLEHVRKVQAFHFKFGQAAKTGTGGHLPGAKVTGRIAEVRGLEPGTAAISPATFTDLVTTCDFRELADAVREVAGGIPIGAKLSAQHIEADLDAALEIGVDYVILDGRGGATGAAPALFRDHISVPTIPALARARRHLDSTDASVTLIITGGLRVPTDFAKALALGADAVAVSNAALHAIGCIAMRACKTDNCPVGIATQKNSLRSRLEIAESARRLTRFFAASVELMRVLARACSHERLADLRLADLTTFIRELSHLAGVPYGGLNPKP